MRELQAGQNQALGTGKVTVGISGEPLEDFAAKTRAGAILLGADGQALHREQMIGAEQPHSAHGAITFTGYPPAFCIELDALPAAVLRIAIVLIVHTAQRGVTFGVFSALRTWVTAADDKPLLVFPLPLARRGETAMIMGELYRHQGRWKFRAVGQGFAAGMPALATHFGLKPAPAQAAPDLPPSAAHAGSATGFCISNAGYVLTNYHVIEGARHIQGSSLCQRYQLHSVFSDASNDLALLRAEPVPPAVATLRSGSAAQLGEAVVVVGYPLGGLLGSGPQVTTGNVSALTGPGNDTRTLQFTAPTQAGNSGGPLLAVDGSVIGVVTAKLNALRVQEMTGDMPQNVNFAIKSALVQSFLEAAGIVYQTREAGGARLTAALAAEARDFVLKIEC